MKTRSNLRWLVLVALIALVPPTYPCSLARGYFYQVTQLRGAIVGVNNGDPRHLSSWLRQRVARSDVKLTLYEYGGPARSYSEMRVAKTTAADEHGNFDFGTLQDGHYTLAVSAPWGDDPFDVQIVQMPKRTLSVMIDVSPIHPDCTGGHEFIVTTE